MQDKVFTAVKIQITVFWVVTLNSVRVQYQHFGGPWCLHLQQDFQNAGILLQHYTSLQPRKPWPEHFQPQFKCIINSVKKNYVPFVADTDAVLKKEHTIYQNNNICSKNSI